MPTRSRARSAARARPPAASSSAATSTSATSSPACSAAAAPRADAPRSRGAGRARARAVAPTSIGQLPVSFAEAALGTKRTIRTGAGGDGRDLRPARRRERRAPARSRQGGGGAGAGGVPGDLYLDVEVRPDPHLRRAGDDIELDLPVTITEAVLGAKVEVPTVEGPVTLSIPPGTSSGARLRLRGRGIKRPDGTRGDQIARVEIVAPKIKPDDAETRKLFEEIAERTGAGRRCDDFDIPFPTRRHHKGARMSTENQKTLPLLVAAQPRPVPRRRHAGRDRSRQLAAPHRGAGRQGRARAGRHPEGRRHRRARRRGPLHDLRRGRGRPHREGGREPRHRGAARRGAPPRHRLHAGEAVPGRHLRAAGRDPQGSDRDRRAGHGGLRRRQAAHRHLARHPGRDRAGARPEQGPGPAGRHRRRDRRPVARGARLAAGRERRRRAAATAAGAAAAQGRADQGQAEDRPRRCARSSRSTSARRCCARS